MIIVLFGTYLICASRSAQMVFSNVCLRYCGPNMLIRNFQQCLQTVPQTQNSNRIVLEASIKCLYCTLAILCPCYSAVPKIEIESNHVKKTPNKWDPRISLWSFPDEFQPADVVEPQSWHQGIHIVKVDLSSNWCFRC